MNVFRAVSADESPLLWSHGGQRDAALSTIFRIEMKKMPPRG
jgi:hypothetical protein